MNLENPFSTRCLGPVGQPDQFVPDKVTEVMLGYVKLVGKVLPGYRRDGNGRHFVDTGLDVSLLFLFFSG